MNNDSLILTCMPHCYVRAPKYSSLRPINALAMHPKDSYTKTGLLSGETIYAQTPRSINHAEASARYR